MTRPRLDIIAASLALTTPALAAGGWTMVLFHTINLAVLLWLLVRFAGPAINRGIRAKADTVERDIAEASRLHAEAQALLTEYEHKLSQLDARAEELIEQYRRDGEAEKARLITEAQAESERIRAEAERAAENEIARARARLESEVVDLAITAAEQAIRNKLGPADHRRLTADYLGRLEETLRG
jgi:F-type H+-transporting ATPase subunit b